jgi:acyl-coenzyme A thioesterase PaaI-like protein
VSQSNLLLSAWKTLSPLPLGKRAFSKLTGLKVPYFRSIDPTMIELRPGRCEALLRKRWSVTNHLGTVHAIAMCNLAEYCGGLLAEASVPASHRWIPKGMTVEYRLKAETDLTAVCEYSPLPEFGDQAFDWPVTVNVSDTAGQVVFSAVIQMCVSPRKG